MYGEHPIERVCECGTYIALEADRAPLRRRMVLLKRDRVTRRAEQLYAYMHGQTAAQRSDLVAFLRSLTDDELLHDSRFANPWTGARSP